ncbi:asparagine synthase-related protein [Sphingomonas colocasiae]|uniref:asparagine synthase (glutamine-hydrolyzing) n=1 Tax=Sphingomonas colocasiae TaxID=1848973 RepID=A0ABS7PTK0_9SPHN|nr:asparagine synthase-related protein [Sphingomonas colocasiae]MBY8823319.1 hypothetical protein [Sphingomonas colocasiae]MBY8826454.1 hypothetical protein [Sphingomonas colocasiae]
MSPRWILAIGADTGGRRQIETRAGQWGLVNRCETRGFTLLADLTLPVPADGVAGLAVVGRLFGSQDFSAVGRLGDEAASAIAGDPASVLRDRYWGGYVAAVCDSASGETRLLRDPSGAVPVYWAKLPSLWIVSGDARLLCDVIETRIAIDYTSLAARLFFPGHHGARTCLAGVTELLPGEMLTIGRSASASCWWRPSDHVRDLGMDASALEAVIDRTVHALAGRHHRIVLTVSGGLDSSILASSLAGQPCPVDLLTVASRDPRGDERGYAGMLARSLGRPLASRWYDHGGIDVRLPSVEHPPWPGARTFAQGYDRLRQAHARALGADAIFSGDGGDNVFGLTMSAAPVIDRLMAEGPRAAMASAADIARLTGVGIPAVWRSVAGRMLRRGRGMWREDAAFLTPGAVRLARRLPFHPWLEESRGLPPGKRAHIASLVRAQRYAEGYARGPAEAVLPLLAQPIVEACLSIPRWRWCEGGENRAVARRAFAGRLPEAIVHRRSKGGPDAFCVEIVERNRAGIRAHLLDGLLVREGLVDGASAEASIACGEAERGDVHRILALVDAEAWARHWSGAG